jgi:hypothetical protein
MLNPTRASRLDGLIAKYREGLYTAHEVRAAAVALLAIEGPAEIVERLPDEVMPLLRDWAASVSTSSKESWDSDIFDFKTPGLVADCCSPGSAWDKAVALHKYLLGETETHQASLDSLDSGEV